MPARSVLTSTAVATLALVAAPGAHAAFPGANGPIVYTQYKTVPFPGDSDDYEIIGDVRGIASDGTGDHVIAASTTPLKLEGSPFGPREGDDIPEDSASPSPDGRHLVYKRSGLLWLSAIDGSGAAPLAKTAFADAPSWSPDAKTLIWGYEEVGLRTFDVTAGAAPTARPVTIVKTPSLESLQRRQQRPFVLINAAEPQFAQDGRSVVYLRLRFSQPHKRLVVSTSYWTAGPDGSNPHLLFRGKGDARTVLGFDLSPDGKSIAFVASGNWKTSARALFVANLDGSGLRKLAVAKAGHWSYGTPTWSPEGKQIVVPQNESSPKRAGQLDLVDATTGATKVIRSVSGSLLDEPRWAVAPR